MLETQDDLGAILKTSAIDVNVSQSRSRVDVMALLQRAPLPYRPAEPNTPPTREETAATIHDAAIGMRRGLEGIARGVIDMDQIAASAAAARRGIEEAPGLFLEVTRLKMKDRATYLHSVAVAGLMSRMAQLLDFDEESVEEMGKAGLLHDLGKLLIPNTILNKPGKLNPAEWRLVRNHPELGYRHLKKMGGVSDLVLDICRLHHEALDGTGYPLGLKDEQISLAVRIASVCDVFEALTTVRPYKQAWGNDQALTWMYEQSNLLDRKLVLRLGSIFG